MADRFHREQSRCHVLAPLIRCHLFLKSSLEHPAIVLEQALHPLAGSAAHLAIIPQYFHSVAGTSTSAFAGAPSAVSSPFTWSPWKCEITTMSMFLGSNPA